MWDAYIAACAPEIGQPTLAAIVQVESRGYPWAINDNQSKRSVRPRSYGEAVRIATKLIKQGHSVDIGLAQINSRNLRRLGLSVAEAFEPCRNLQAASVILRECYGRAAGKHGQGQRALMHALSCYNTGSLYAGRRYVQRILSAAGAGGEVLRWADATLIGSTRPMGATGRAILAQFSGKEKWRVF